VNVTGCQGHQEKGLREDPWKTKLLQAVALRLRSPNFTVYEGHAQTFAAFS
jgi:hypothetical protein